MKPGLFFCAIFLILGCSSVPKVVIDHEEYHVRIPPNTVEVANNIYVDKSEISNSAYQLYLEWTKKVYGVKSEEYQSAIPDQTVWDAAPDELKDLEELYFTHEYFDSYPVVGLRYDQAKGYSKWRSDRVNEAHLINNRLIKPNPKQTGQDHFTIERFLENIDSLKSKKKIPDVFVEYQIPTKSEWEKYIIPALKSGRIKGSFVAEMLKLDTLNQSATYNHDDIEEFLKQSDKKYDEKIFTDARYTIGFRNTCRFVTWRKTDNQ